MSTSSDLHSQLLMSNQDSDLLDIPRNFNYNDKESDIEIDPHKIDDELSKRFIALDPAGYFIIYIDPSQNLICAKHYTNAVNDRGLAVDPETGKVIPAKGKVTREPSHIFQAFTAKQLCVKIFEEGLTENLVKNLVTNQGKTLNEHENNLDAAMITMLDHAAYIGREAQKAEWALRHHQEYIQD
jgi:dihydropteroate synthase